MEYLLHGGGDLGGAEFLGFSPLLGEGLQLSLSWDHLFDLVSCGFVLGGLPG